MIWHDSGGNNAVLVQELCSVGSLTGPVLKGIPKGGGGGEGGVLS